MKLFSEKPDSMFLIPLGYQRKIQSGKEAYHSDFSMPRSRRAKHVFFFNNKKKKINLSVSYEKQNGERPQNEQFTPWPVDFFPKRQRGKKKDWARGRRKNIDQMLNNGRQKSFFETNSVSENFFDQKSLTPSFCIEAKTNEITPPQEMSQTNKIDNADKYQIGIYPLSINHKKILSSYLLNPLSLKQQNITSYARIYFNSEYQFSKKKWMNEKQMLGSSIFSFWRTLTSCFFLIFSSPLQGLNYFSFPLSNEKKEKNSSTLEGPSQVDFGSSRILPNNFSVPWAFSFSPKKIRNNFFFEESLFPIPHGLKQNMKKKKPFIYRKKKNIISFFFSLPWSRQKFFFPQQKIFFFSLPPAFYFFWLKKITKNCLNVTNLKKQIIINLCRGLFFFLSEKNPPKRKKFRK